MSRLTKKLAGLTAIAVAAPLVVLGSASAANAASSATVSPATVGNCNLNRIVQNVKFIGTSTTWPSGANWGVGGRGPGPLTLSKAVTVSNSVSGTFGVSYAAVSASVGFDVSWSETTSTSYTYVMPNALHYYVWAGYSSAEYQFSVYQRRGYFQATKGGGYCTGYAGKTYVGVGYASYVQNLEYRHYQG